MTIKEIRQHKNNTIRQQIFTYLIHVRKEIFSIDTRFFTVSDALDEDIYNSTDWITTSTPFSGAKRKRNCAWIDFTDFEASSREEFIAKLNGQGFDSSCCYCDLYAGIKFVSSVTKDARTSPNGISYDYH